jgi:hypothetical protein
VDKETLTTLIEAQREQNKQIRLDYQRPHDERELGQLKESYGVDFTTKEAVAMLKSHKFSWKALKQKAQRMKEAVGENTVGFVLRGATQAICAQWYELLPPEHEKLFLTTSSDSAIELIPIVQRGGQMRRAVRGTPPADTDIQGIDQSLINYLFLGKVRVERSLIEDDKTGLIQQRIMDLGKLPQYVEDAWVFTKWIGAAGTVPGTNDPIPASQMKPYNEVNGWPWSTGLVGGGVNRLATYAPMSEGGIQALDIQAAQMTDIQGNKLLVNLTHIVVGTAYKFIVKQITGSKNFMSTVPMQVGGSGAQTTIGTTFAENVLAGAYEPFVSRFLPVKAWGLQEAMKGHIFQRRSANELIQVDPTSDESVDTDSYIYRVRARWNSDTPDSRFGQLGSDGSK